MSTKIQVFDSTGHHAPTAASRKAVAEGVACGLEVEDIAYLMGISPYEVEFHYKEELERGTRITSAEVASAILKNAKNGDSSSQQFWMKHRAGWAAANKVELTGKDGGAIQVEERKKSIDTVVELMMSMTDPRKNDVVKQ